MKAHGVSRVLALASLHGWDFGHTGSMTPDHGRFSPRAIQWDSLPRTQTCSGKATTILATTIRRSRRLSFSGIGLPVGSAPLLAWVLHAERARPVRFALTGGISGLGQLVVLAALVSAGWKGMPANGAAMLFGAEINFLLGCTFTWRDRHDPRSLARRWAVFHCSIVGTAAINMLVFGFAQTVLPALVASACGIAVAAVGNFLAGDLLVFRSKARIVCVAG